MPLRWLLVPAFGALFAGACGPPPVHGIKTGKFLPGEKLAAVQICRSTGNDLLQQFGQPYSQGRDGDFATMQWTAMIVATDNTTAGMASQNVLAWVDSSGLVAGFVVNPTGLPTTPLPCTQQTPAPQEPTVPEPQPKTI